NMDRLNNIEELEPLLEESFATAGTQEWIRRCNEAGVPCGPINNFKQAMEDPHYRERGMVASIDHPVIGKMDVIGIPTKFSRTPGALRKAAPLFGEDTDEVLRSVGFTDSRIEALKAKGAAA